VADGGGILNDRGVALALEDKKDPQKRKKALTIAVRPESKNSLWGEKKSRGELSPKPGKGLGMWVKRGKKRMRSNGQGRVISGGKSTGKRKKFRGRRKKGGGIYPRCEGSSFGSVNPFRIGKAGGRMGEKGPVYF